MPSDASGADADLSARYLADRAGIRPGDRILDAGCGVAGPAVAMAKSRAGVSIDGVTISGVQAAMASGLVREQGIADRVRVHHADFHRLPFRAATFDVVMFLEVTGYSHSLRELYAEAARVLRDGGVLYVKDVFQPVQPLTRQQRDDQRSFDELWGVVASPTLEATNDAIVASGFEVRRSGTLDHVETEWFFEAMFDRGDFGVRPNAFGRNFFKLYDDLPAFFGEVLASKQSRQEEPNGSADTG